MLYEVYDKHIKRRMWTVVTEVSTRLEVMANQVKQDDHAEEKD